MDEKVKMDELAKLARRIQEIAKDDEDRSIFATMVIGSETTGQTIRAAVGSGTDLIMATAIGISEMAKDMKSPVEDIIMKVSKAAYVVEDFEESRENG